MSAALLVNAGRARAGSQADVLTQHNDGARSGVTFGEEILSPSTVNAESIGKIGTLPVDGRVYAQPLYLAGVDMGDAGTHDVVYVATEHNSLYAFDADSLDPTPLFKVNFGTAVPSSTIGCPDLVPEVGITATPTIDPVTGLLYVEVRTIDEGVQSHTLHAVNVSNGLDALTPAVISATVKVSGHADVVFDPKMHNSRPGLLLANGNVYLAFSSLCDYGPYHGWIFSYSASTLEQQNVFVTTPVGGNGGIWMGGGGLVSDSLGNVYASIGNGTMDMLDGGQDISMAMARWTPDLQLTDWFSPYDEATLSGADLDIGPCPTMLLEDQGLLIGAGKGIFETGTTNTLSFPVYVANSNNLGHQHAMDNDQLIQSIATPMPVKYGWSGMATFPGPAGPQLFLCGAGMPLTSYQFSGGAFSQVATSPVVAPANHEGAPMSISTSGPDAGPGILWLLMALTDGDGYFEDPTGGVLRAFSTADVTTELWDSNLNPARDSVGSVAKFTTPTVANGRVYTATFAGVVDVYGLLPPDGGGEVEDGGDGGGSMPDAGDSGVADDGGPDAGDAGQDAGQDAGKDGGDSGVDSGQASTSSSSSTGANPPPSSGGCSCSSGSTLWCWAALPVTAIWFRRRRRR